MNTIERPVGKMTLKDGTWFVAYQKLLKKGFLDENGKWISSEHTYIYCTDIYPCYLKNIFDANQFDKIKEGVEVEFELKYKPTMNSSYSSFYSKENMPFAIEEKDMHNYIACVTKIVQ